MKLNILKITDDAAELSSFADVFGSSNPTTLFVGGFLHLDGEANGNGLRNLLVSLAKGTASACYCEEKEKTPWEDKYESALRFNKTAQPGEMAKGFADSIFSAFGGQPSLKELQMSFSKVTFLCYSHGTNLISQVVSLLRSRLEQMSYTQSDIATALSSLVSVNIGPTYVNPAPQDGLPRLTVVYRGDARAKEIYGFRYPPVNEHNHIITVNLIDGTLLLVPERGSPTERAIITDLSSGKESIRYVEYEEAHSLYMYTNIAYEKTYNGKTLKVFPSLPTAIDIWNVCEVSLESAAESIRTGTPRNGHEILQSYFLLCLSQGHLRDRAICFAEEEELFLSRLGTTTRPVFKRSLVQS